MCTFDNSTCASSNYSLANEHYWFNFFGEARDVSTVFSTLSCIGSSLIILSFIIWPQLWKATSRKILVYISLCDLGASIINAISSQNYPGGTSKPGCQAQGFFWILFTLGFVLWSMCLSVYLYISIVLVPSQGKGRRTLNVHKYVVYSHLICWGIPVAVATAALLCGALGNTASIASVGWCWVTTAPLYPRHMSCQSAMFFWMMLTLKAWECIAYVVIPVFYILVLRWIRKETSGDRRERMGAPLDRAIRDVNIKLAVLPVCFVILRVWGTVRVFLDVAEKLCHIQLRDHSRHFLQYTQAVGDNSQGFVNFLLFFCLTATVKQGVVQAIASLLQRLRWSRRHGHTAADGADFSSVNRNEHERAVVRDRRHGDGQDNADVRAHHRDDSDSLLDSMSMKTRSPEERRSVSPPDTGHRQGDQERRQLLSDEGSGQAGYGTSK